MIDHTLIAIYNPKDEEDWFLFKTDKGQYELRVGCFVESSDERSETLKMDIDFKPCKIIRIKSNDFNLYFELEDGSCIVHVESYITGMGDMYFEIRYWDPKQFEIERNEWYNSDSDLKELYSNV